MAFRLPTLGLTLNLWRAGQRLALPPIAPPDLSDVPCALHASPLAMELAGYFTFTETIAVAYLPAHADIRGPHAGVDGDLVEIPAGTGRFYQVFQVEDRAKGFGNEYRMATISQQHGQPGGWRYPTP